MEEVNPVQSIDPELDRYERTIDFKDQINHQISICRQYLNQAITKNTIDMAMEAINTLRSLLIYWVERDATYKKDWKEAEDKRNGILKALNKSEAEEKELTMNKELARKKFELLLNLATKKGFTVMKSSKAYIKKVATSTDGDKALEAQDKPIFDRNPVTEGSE